MCGSHSGNKIYSSIFSQFYQAIQESVVALLLEKAVLYQNIYHLKKKVNFFTFLSIVVRTSVRP